MLIPGAGSGGSDTTDLKLSVESVDFPRYGTSVINFRWMNEVRKVAGGAKVEAMTVTIRDYVDINTYGIVNGWMEKVHSNANGSIGMASRYKGQGYLTLLTPEGVDRSSNGNGVDRSSNGNGIECLGVWPSEFSASRLDFENDQAIVKINLTLQIDKINGLDIVKQLRTSQVGEKDPAQSRIN